MKLFRLRFALSPKCRRYGALFLFLLAVYLLTYTPRVNSSDGIAMVATAESLARRGALDVEQIRWMGLQQGTYGLDGLLYSRKGIGVPLGLLPLVWLGLVMPGLGPVSLSLLFNALVTALTAALLLSYLTRLGFSSTTGLVTALTFGLGTLAWPYAKSLFSDPFSGLLLLAAAWLLLAFRRTGHSRYAFGAGLLLGWNVATRYAEALFLPVFGLLLLYYGWQITIYEPRFTKVKFVVRRSSLVTSVLAFAAPIAAIGLSLMAFNLSRYGDPFNTGYLPTETFSAVWWRGIAGQLVSPGRGLLLYSPIFILTFVGAPAFFRRHRPEAALALSIILIHLLLYGKWFMWHGGFAWGPRFLVPTLPFWALLLAPVAAWRGWRGALFIFLAILGVGIQLQPVLVDFTPFQGFLLDSGLPLFDPQTFFDPQYSPLLHGWRFITRQNLDVAWAWQGRINWGLLVALLANVALTGWNLRISESTNRLTILPLFTTLAATVFLLIHTHTLPPGSLQAAVAELNSSVRPADVVILNNPEATLDFAELYKGRAPVLGLNSGGFPLPDDITRRLDETLTGHAQAWWLPNWLPPQESAIEQTLLARGFRARNEDFGGQRLGLFALPPALSAQPARPVNRLFGETIELTAIAAPAEAEAGAALPVELRWVARQPVGADYRVFIHVLDGQGNKIAQADGQPVNWSRPTSTWAVGEEIIDRYGLWLPPETSSGAYTLLMGLYNPADGVRLSLPDGTDAVMVTIEITPRSNW